MSEQSRFSGKFEKTDLVVGFTGTRLGLSASASAVLKELVVWLPLREAHHGDCTGADEHFHWLCKDKSVHAKTIAMHVHPGCGALRTVKKTGALQGPHMSDYERMLRAFVAIDSDDLDSIDRGMVPIDKRYDPRPYLQRNHDIVDASDILIACPKSIREEKRSGTWATVRYARSLGKPIIFVPARDSEVLVIAHSDKAALKYEELSAAIDKRLKANRGRGL